MKEENNKFMEMVTNKKIENYSKLNMINTDNISDGKNTFGELYQKMFQLEQALVICQEQNYKI